MRPPQQTGENTLNISDTETETLDFSLLLASSVHDIKNSLSMLLNSLAELTGDEQLSEDQRQNFGILQGEASRINHSLIHLLGLYRLQHKQLTIGSDEVFVADFLEEQMISQQLLFDANKVSVSIECDEQLCGYFDQSLIAGVISNILVNCAKYTRDHISLRAQAHGIGLKMEVIDNGSGYPQAIIDELDNHRRGVDFNTGSTNLGLYFADRIARMHHCKGQQGSIALSNAAAGGGVFTLTLP